MQQRPTELPESGGREIVPVPQQQNTPDPLPMPPVESAQPTQASYTPPDGQEQGGGCGWGLAGAGGCLALLAVVILVPVLVGGVTFSSLLGGFGNLFNSLSAPPEAQITSSRTIVNSVQPLGQLVSVSAQLAKADIGVAVSQGPLNACAFSANHVAQGTVEAGIDLTLIDEADVTYDETTDTYTVTLPAPQLTSCRVDYIRQYDRSASVCVIDWDEARLLANYLALTEFRDDAIEGNVLERARRETILVITNFVAVLTGSNVEVIFAEPEDGVTPLPPSCEPDIPAGWVFDPPTNTWIKP